MSRHLTDEQLQLIAENNAAAIASVASHLKECAVCRLKIDNYRMIFNALQTADRPVFNFDLAATITNHVARRKKKIALPAIAAMLAFAVGLIILVSKITPLATTIFKGLSAVTFAMLIVPLIIALVIQLLTNMMQHDQRMQQLMPD